MAYNDQTRQQRIRDKTRPTWFIRYRLGNKLYRKQGSTLFIRLDLATRVWVCQLCSKRANVVSHSQSEAHFSSVQEHNESYWCVQESHCLFLATAIADQNHKSSTWNTAAGLMKRTRKKCLSLQTVRGFQDAHIIKLNAFVTLCSIVMYYTATINHPSDWKCSILRRFPPVFYLCNIYQEFNWLLSNQKCTVWLISSFFTSHDLIKSSRFRTEIKTKLI